MPRPTFPLVIDARPRGPHGPLAGELVQGRCVLGHLLDMARNLDDATVVIHARLEEHPRLGDLLADRSAAQYVFATGPPPENATILRTDRLYDLQRLHRALRKGKDPESAVLWRLDQPHGLSGAEAELTRRQSYQPLGRYWALFPAQTIARLLRPTRIRPNAITFASASLVVGAALAVAFLRPTPWAHLAEALALALALVLDTSDGHLARIQGTASELGRWLDATLDELGDMALHAAIAWSAFARDGHPGWLLLGMLYGIGKYLFVVTTTVGQTEEKTGTARSPHISPAVTASLPVVLRQARLKSWVRLMGHADIRWHLWIVLAAIGRLDAALIVYAVYFPVRALGSGLGKVVRDA
ncbi:CDP-alcohol phosphatidyltransferase family protein [Singulisphaera acidiphila]|uniref:Phosphatidylglycerophosphate synthase n=1 Tax=Singulisphaera acidiphila (strain ATCC BAA-1392 / DSM 18658 / VKM B-2454 / MOB10) TaxID=886293 RepID=L0DEG3_SINAD|nr:CDP-alcohol phosphatidyltransferase family protein [Singulisphaera acidiphila]AGA27245.1 phosphatidylglycerophosphate synthase [Singulisphaera acidiphila DSM 18658]